MIRLLTPPALPPLAAPEPVPRLLHDLVHERTGIFFEEKQHGVFLEKLESRVRACGCTSYLDYYYLLKYDDRGPVEWQRVMDAFSVQETYFWRETDQVRALTERIVPDWFAANRGPLRIWSAACATGEEPYSIAIALEEAGLGHHPVEIVASDASEAALGKARAGLYRARSFRTLPLALRDKYFAPSADGLQIDPSIASRVRFRWANLMSPDHIEEMADSPVIFCRNVFIYFSDRAIRQVVASFARRAQPGYHLMVGASESLIKFTEQYELTELAGAFVYVRRKSAA